MQCRLRLRFLIADRKQRLVERVNVGRDVDSARYEDASAEQQVGHGSNSKAAQSFLTAFEHRFTFASLAERLHGAIGETRLGANIGQYRDVTDVGTTLEICAENGRC